MTALINLPRAAWRRQPSGPVKLTSDTLRMGITNWTFPGQMGPGFVSSSVGLRAVNQGMAFDFNDTDVYQRFTDQLDYSRGEVSGFAVINPLTVYTAGGQGIGTYFSTRTSGNSGWSFHDLSARGYSTGNEVLSLMFTLHGVTDYNYELPVGALPALLGQKTVGFRVKSNTPVDFFIDGKKYSRSGDIGTIAAGSDWIIGKAGPFDFSYEHYGQPMLLAMTADRFLDERVFVELTANPWQLFQPAPSRFYLIPSSGPVTYQLSSALTSVSTVSVSDLAVQRDLLSACASLSSTSSIPNKKRRHRLFL